MRYQSRQASPAELMLFAVHVGDNDAVMVFATDVKTALKHALEVEPVYMLQDPLNVVVLEVTVNWLYQDDARGRHTRAALQRGDPGIGEYNPGCGWIIGEIDG